MCVLLTKRLQNSVAAEEGGGGDPEAKKNKTTLNLYDDHKKSGE